MQDLNIIIIDDDDVDIVAVRRALRNCRADNPVHVAHDGIEALELLRGDPGPGHPILVLLDINMPRMNGLEFLEELRADPALRDTRVLVLSTSDEERDRQAACRLDVAAYLVKQEAGRDFRRLVALIDVVQQTGRLPSANSIGASS